MPASQPWIESGDDVAFIDEDDHTDRAVKRWQTAHTPRLADLMTTLVRYAHAYAREVGLTEQEWLTAMDWLAATGKISDEKRHEFILASDVLGISTLVVQLNNQFSASATPATVLGPFYIEGSPDLGFGHDMSENLDGTPLFVTGRVTDLGGHGLPNIAMDVWQADADGNYEAQLPDIGEARLRARYHTRDDGSYCVQTIAPRGYSIPMDGPVGHLINRTSISPYRPAHFHIRIDEPGYKKLTTHLFREHTEYLDSDVVFGVRDALVVPFETLPPGPTPDGRHSETSYLCACYDIVLDVDY